MSFPGEDDVIQTRFPCTFAGKRAFIIRHFQVQLLVGSVSLNDICFNIDLAISPALIQMISPLAEWEGCFAANLTQPELGPEEHTNATFSFPIESAGILPPQIACLFNLGTGTKGLHTRGRVFTPFVPIEGFDPATGQKTVAFEATAQATADTLKAVVNVFVFTGTCTMIPVIWHRQTQTATRIVSATSNPGWATQRRRGFGWGGD